MFFHTSDIQARTSSKSLKTCKLTYNAVISLLYFKVSIGYKLEIFYKNNMVADTCSK